MPGYTGNLNSMRIVAIVLPGIPLSLQSPPSPRRSGSWAPPGTSPVAGGIRGSSSGSPEGTAKRIKPYQIYCNCFIWVSSESYGNISCPGPGLQVNTSSWEKQKALFVSCLIDISVVGDATFWATFSSLCDSVKCYRDEYSMSHSQITIDKRWIINNDKALAQFHSCKDSRIHGLYALIPA